MKKFIASAVAAATAFTVTVPTTHAATLTPTEQGQCRVTLNDAERGPAWQAERIAKTLTHGMYAVSYTHLTLPTIYSV